MPIKKRIYRPYKYDIETCYKIYHEYKDNPIATRKEIATKYNITEKTLKNWEDSFEKGDYQQIYEMTTSKKSINSSDRRKKQIPKTPKKNSDDEFISDLLKNRNPVTGEYIENNDNSLSYSSNSEKNISSNFQQYSKKNIQDDVIQSLNNIKNDDKNFVKKNNGKRIKVVSLHNHDEFLNNIIDKNNNV